MANLLNYILPLMLFCGTPALIMWLCRRFPALDKIGPIMLLYAVGMVVGNIGILPAEVTTLQEIIPNIAIPLAIPMMLFGCQFSRHEAGKQIKIVISGFLSVCVAVVFGYMLFGRHISQGAEVGGIISGMYTGGTINAAALQAIFQINSENYILINSYDIIISFLYFVFLFSVGIRLFRKAYRASGCKATAALLNECEAMEDTQSKAEESLSARLFCRRGMAQLGRIVLLTLLIAGISAGVALLMPEGWFMVVFILLITTLGVASSFLKPVRKFDLSYDVGMYLIYIFSITIASMANFKNLDLVTGINQLAFMTFAVFVSLTIHAIVCRLMKVDADSMVISSVAFINSPPFVPMAAAAMNNKKALLTGLGAGIVGYAVGNHFGVLMALLLSKL
jgi:uncharacterized membrane protein